MKLLKIGSALLALTLAMAGNNASAQDFKAKLVQAGVITVATSGSAPPFSMTDATGKLDGFDIDVMNRISTELGVPVRYTQVDFAGLLPGLTAGRFDVVASGVTRTPQRLTSTEFKLLSPYIVNGVAITRRAGDTRINSWKDVCGKRMGGVRGGIFQKMATDKLPAGCATEIREYPGFSEMLLDLGNNRIDFMAHDYLGPNFQKMQTKANIDVLPDVIDTITQSVAVSAKNPELADTIEKLLAKWRGDKSLDAMIKKRFGGSLDWSVVK
jgi:ABC-type amino acid transport substrate-binding protein